MSNPPFPDMDGLIQHLLDDQIEPEEMLRQSCAGEIDLLRALPQPGPTAPSRACALAAASNGTFRGERTCEEAH